LSHIQPGSVQVIFDNHQIDTEKLINEVDSHELFVYTDGSDGACLELHTKIEMMSLLGRNLEYADLSNAKFLHMNLFGTKFANADLSEAQFSRCTLKKASFFKTCLAGVKFSECNLKEANFRFANLCGTDFSTAVLDANNQLFIGAKYDSSTLWPKNFTIPTTAIQVEASATHIALSPEEMKNDYAATKVELAKMREQVMGLKQQLKLAQTNLEAVSKQLEAEKTQHAETKAQLTATQENHRQYRAQFEPRPSTSRLGKMFVKAGSKKHTPPLDSLKAEPGPPGRPRSNSEAPQLSHER
jgi:uncharacterized protein YjbI with pentapeptide repeats